MQREQSRGRRVKLVRGGGAVCALQHVCINSLLEKEERRKLSGTFAYPFLKYSISSCIEKSI